MMVRGVEECRRKKKKRKGRAQGVSITSGVGGPSFFFSFLYIPFFI